MVRMRLFDALQIVRFSELRIWIQQPSILTKISTEAVTACNMRASVID